MNSEEIRKALEIAVAATDAECRRLVESAKDKNEVYHGVEVTFHVAREKPWFASVHRSWHDGEAHEWGGGAGGTLEEALAALVVSVKENVTA